MAENSTGELRSARAQAGVGGKATCLASGHAFLAALAGQGIEVDLGELGAACLVLVALAFLAALFLDIAAGRGALVTVRKAGGASSARCMYTPATGCSAGRISRSSSMPSTRQAARSCGAMPGSVWAYGERGERRTLVDLRGAALLAWEPAPEYRAGELGLLTDGTPRRWKGTG